MRSWSFSGDSVPEGRTCHAMVSLALQMWHPVLFGIVSWHELLGGVCGSRDDILCCDNKI